MLTRVVEILQRRHAERVPALEKELAQLAAEQQRCRQEGKRELQAIGSDEARQSGITTERIAELDERADQLELRMAELRNELAAVQRENVSAAQISARSRSSIRSGTCSSWRSITWASPAWLPRLP
jgi:hypothetical protein